jgi:hypothetical protein
MLSSPGTLSRPSCFNGFCPPATQPYDPANARATTVKSGHKAVKPVTVPPWLAGLAGVGVGSYFQHRLAKKWPLKATSATSHMYLPAAVKRQQYLNFNNPLYALVRLATLYEQYHGPLLAYLGATAFGAVMASLLQGLQETWVRQQETRIRQQLIQNLQGSFANSLAIKYRFDADLREETRQAIHQALTAQGINPARYLAIPAPEVVNKHDTPYLPAHPTVRTQRFGADTSLSTGYSPNRLAMAWAGLGVATGALLGHMARWLRQQKHKLPIAQQEVMECLVTTDLESAFLLRHKGMLAGVFGLSALAKVGQLLLNATREVAVTQKNAETERQYQQNNWQVLDPQFHQIAERAALTAEWDHFTQDLPQLKRQPDLLQARIHQLMTNRGKASPPGYYLATPPVMLSEAKS